MKRIGTYTWRAAIVLLCLCLVFYFLFSDNPSNWGSFGDYIGGIGSIVLSMAVFLYTYQVDKRTEEKKRSENNVQLLREVGQLLTTLEQYKGQCKRSNCSPTSLLPQKSDPYEIVILKVEIRISFARCVSLAKLNGIDEIPGKDEIIHNMDVVEKYVNDWLGYIETKTLYH